VRIGDHAVFDSTDSIIVDIVDDLIVVSYKSDNSDY
jgi:hypothetical protein